MKKILFASFLLALNHHFCFATDYYFTSVGTEGTGSYTLASPYVDADLSEVNVKLAAAMPGDRIFLKRGDTFTGTISITKSGTAASPITIGAFGSGAKPKITSFKSITSWTSLGSNKYVSGTISTLPINTVQMLAVNNYPAVMGRYPNLDNGADGWLDYDAATTTSITDAAMISSATANLNHGQVVMRTARYKMDRYDITGHSGTTINFVVNTKYGAGGNSPKDASKTWGYFVQDHPYLLDQDGEWYHDTAAKTIQIYSTTNLATNPSSKTVQVATLNHLLTAYLKSYVTIDNIDFFGANGNTVDIDTCTGFNITNCKIYFNGQDGIHSDRSIGLRFDYDTIFYSMNNGFKFDQKANGSIWGYVGHLYMNNSGTFRGMGLNNAGNYIGMLTDGSTGYTLEYYRIDSSGYAGLTWKGSDALNQYGFISHHNMTLNDGGGMYLQDASNNDAPKFNRKLHHVIIMDNEDAHNGSDSQADNSAGLYMDDGTDNVQADNIYVANEWNGTWQHQTMDNSLRNSLFFNSKNIAIYFQHDDHQYPMIRDTFTNNIYFATKPSLGPTNNLLTQFFWSSTVADVTPADSIGQIGRIDSNYYIQPLLYSGGVKNSNIIKQSIQGRTPQDSFFTVVTFPVRYPQYEQHIHESPKFYNYGTVPGDDIIDSTRFLYNITSAPVTYSLNGKTYVDSKGTAYNSGFVTLQPYTAWVGILTSDVPVRIEPLADAFVRDGTYTTTNYGTDTILYVKSSGTVDLNRQSFLKFNIDNMTGVTAVKLRVYGNNNTDNVSTSINCYGVNSDSWTETGITWTNRPTSLTSSLGAISVNNTLQYYEFDVTSFVQTEFAGDKVASFVIKDPAGAQRSLLFKSKEAAQFHPLLVFQTASAQLPLNNKLRNPDILISPEPAPTASVAALKVYPNPAKKFFNVIFPDNLNGNFSLQLLDVNGAAYELGRQVINDSKRSVLIDVPKNINKTGTFYLQLNSDKGFKQTIKVELN